MPTAMDIPSNSPLQQPPADYCPVDSARWFTLQEGPDAGKKMFYYDMKLADPSADNPSIGNQSTILLVHGNPENSYTFRHIRQALVASGKPVRLIAMDHIGFGLSDQASFEMVDMHHADNLRQLVEYLDLQQVSLAVHDWGGPIGIGAFISQTERVSSLLVMNSTVFPMPDDGYTYRNFPFSWLPWYKTPDLIPDSLWGGMAGYLVSNGSPQSVLTFVMGAAKFMLLHAMKKIPAGTPEHCWAEALRSKTNVKSSKRMVRQTPVWGHGYSYVDPQLGSQDNHAFYQQLQQSVMQAWGPAGRNIPASGFFGQWDACGKQSVIAQWQQALPSMLENTHTFADVGHFVEEHKGEQIAAALLAMQ